MRFLNYTRAQSKTFIALTIVNALVVYALTGLGPPRVVFILYALAIPAAFRWAVLPQRPFQSRRIAMAARLLWAMRRRELVYEYQPIVSLRSGRVVAAEALARWAHPRKGILPPAKWLWATDLFWLERRFNHYTLRRVIEELARWQERNIVLRASVNVTPRCMTSDLPKTIRALLEKFQVPARLLTVELTEEIFDSSPAIAAVAAELADIGVSLALDDFGVGHSAMARLVTLPVNALKVDRRFVSDMPRGRGAPVVRAAVGLCHELELRCVAEGVENDETFCALHEMGCDYVQGFFVSRPVPPDALIGWLKRREWIPPRAQEATIAAGECPDLPARIGASTITRSPA